MAAAGYRVDLTTQAEEIAGVPPGQGAVLARFGRPEAKHGLLSSVAEAGRQTRFKMFERKSLMGRT